MQKTIPSQEDMHTFAGEVASELRGGEVLGLVGNLGTGKTEFVRGLAKALGSKDSVKSPSFTLLNHYRLHHVSIKHLIHVDLYRLEGVGAGVVSQIGLDEWLKRDDTIVVIEWPEILQAEFEFTKTFSFTYGEGETTRVVEVVGSRGSVERRM